MRRSNLSRKPTSSFFCSGLIAFMAAIFCISACYAQSTDSIKIQFEQTISKLLGIPVSVESYKLDYGTINLQNLQIGSQELLDQPYAKIKKLSATCDFMSLLGGNLVLKDLSISSMSCELTRNENGEFYKTKEPKDRKEIKNKSVTDLPFLKLEGKDLTLIIKDKSTEKVLISTIDKLNLEKSKDSEQLAINLSGSAKTAKDRATKVPEIATKFSCDLVLSGDIQNPKLHGQANLDSVQVTEKILKQALKLEKTLIKIDEKGITTDSLSGTWGHSNFKISGKIDGFQKLNLSMKYTVSKINIDEISSTIISTKGMTMSGSGASSGKISGSVVNPLINGNFTLPSCKIAIPIGTTGKEKYIFPLKAINGNFNYTGGKIAINDARASIFGGNLLGSGKILVRTKPVKFEINSTGTGLRAEQFLSENTSQKNTISGSVQANFAAKGDTSGLVSLNGKGSFNMKNGRYQAPPVVTPILALVNLKEFSSGDITSGNGSFVLRNGIMTTNDLVFVSSAGKAYYRGDVGLDTSLKGKMNIIFSTEAVTKSQALKQISLDGKSADLPSRVEGTLLNPSFPGFSAQKILELGLKRKGQKMLQDILFPQKKEPSNNQDADKNKKQDPGKKILKDLKKIFKF